MTTTFPQTLSGALRARLVARRKALGLTIIQVATKMGVSRSSVSMYESADIHGTVEFIDRYATAVGLVLELTYDGPPGVVKVGDDWYFEGITYPSRAAARQAAAKS